MIAASPWIFDDRTRFHAVALACLPLMWGVVINCWITRGRHYGWKIFAGIVAAAVIGAAV